MSVKGGNLGARVWSSQLLIDNQTSRTMIPTWPAHSPARGGVPYTWAGPAVINKLDDLADQARATNEERVTFDNLLLPPASQPALTSRTETVRGMPRRTCLLRAVFSSRTHWAFRDSDTLNHVGGPANSFQAICLVVTWALCSGRPHHLLRLACCSEIPCPVPPSRYHRGSMGMAGEGAAAAAAAARESSSLEQSRARSAAP